MIAPTKHTSTEVRRVLRVISMLGLSAFLVSLSLGAVAGGAAQQIPITMRDFSYTPDRITLQAGVPVEITLVNRGKVKHEFIVYPMPKAGMSGIRLHEWAEDNSYFKGLQVVVEGRGIEVERKGPSVVEIQVGAGKSAVVKFTPAKKGTFEFACLIDGHYEAGQKGSLTVK